MKLRKPKDSPPGGFFFITEDGQRITSPTDLRRLVRMVEDYYSANAKPIPPDLAQIIEDQICERLPNDLCWRGFGDVVANSIQVAAGAIDKVLGTQLKTSAKKCGGCAQRKRTLNRLTHS